MKRCIMYGNLSSLKKDGFVIEPRPLAKKDRNLLLDLKDKHLCSTPQKRMYRHLKAVVVDNLFALLLTDKIGNLFGEVVALLLDDRDALQLSHLLQNQVALDTRDELAGLVGHLVGHDVGHLVASFRGNRPTTRRGGKFFCRYNRRVKVVVCVVDMIWSVMDMIWHRVWRKRMGVVSCWVEEITNQMKRILGGSQRT